MVEMVSFQTQSLSVKTLVLYKLFKMFLYSANILPVLYQIQHYSMFIVLLTKKLCKLYIL